MKYRQARDDSARAIIGPDAIEIGPRRLKVGEACCATFAVTGYPTEVAPGFLEPLFCFGGEIKVALHLEPVAPADAAKRLWRQRARLESSRRQGGAKGSLSDPELEAAAEDAERLAFSIARGDGRLFRLGCYLTVFAEDDQSLSTECARLKALCHSMLLEVHPATFRSLEGYRSTLPLGVDHLRLRRSFDTEALAATFPFASSAPSGTNGVFWGKTTRGHRLVFSDRFANDNYNAVVLARSGAGKSYLAKLDLLRHLYRGVEVAVVDPEDEYRYLTDAVGGAHLALGEQGVHLNPFDLGTEPDARVRRGLFLHSLMPVLFGEALSPPSSAALDRGIVSCYESAGITEDPRTWKRRPPLMADLARVLEEDEDAPARELSRRLAPFVSGTHRELFSGQTTTRPAGHLVVFSLRGLPDELKATGTLLALDCCWRRVTDPAQLRPRMVVVDEAWLLMADPTGARFLNRLAKSARKHWCGLTVVTQDAGDLLATPLGEAVVANAATQVLLRQAPQAIDSVRKAFALSAGEQNFLLAADRGEGIVALGPDRVAFRALASEAEHRLVTSDPAELEAARK
ncbi:MAG: VirB4 family type IV secretion system protein [Acidimicrobiales bacterium]